MDPSVRPTAPLQPATARRLSHILDDWRRAEHELATAASLAVASAAAADVRALRREYASAHEVVRQRYAVAGSRSREHQELRLATVLESFGWVR